MAALQWLLKNPEKRKALGLAAAREVRSKWLWKHLVPPMLDVYNEFLVH
jgi:hypothetical protein